MLHKNLLITSPKRGGGQLVGVLAFYSADPSSNPAEFYILSVKLYLKRTKINKKRPGLAHFFLKGATKLSKQCPPLSPIQELLTVTRITYL